MTDPKLIEAVARALDPTAWIPADATTEQVKFCRRGHRRNAARRKAHRLIATVNTGGTYWIAPVEATPAIRYAFAVEADLFAQDRGHGAAGAWSAMRTAYLAKTETT